MLTINNNALEFYFPEVHSEAFCRISLHREDPLERKSILNWLETDRVSLVHVDDYAKALPESWVKRGGVLAPVRQGEHLRIELEGVYPFAVKIASGKVNAITSKPWKEALDPEEQDYLVSSLQPSLSGFCQADGSAKKFIISPLGLGHSMEERVTGAAEFGGIQVMGFPEKAEFYEEAKQRPLFSRNRVEEPVPSYSVLALDAEEAIDEGIEKDDNPHRWKTDTFARCFIHLVSEVDFKRIIGRRATARRTMPISLDSWRQRYH